MRKVGNETSRSDVWESAVNIYKSEGGEGRRSEGFSDEVKAFIVMISILDRLSGVESEVFDIPDVPTLCNLKCALLPSSCSSLRGVSFGEP